MEDFDKAGGVPVLLKELTELINEKQLSVSGETMKDIIENARRQEEYSDIIRIKEKAVLDNGGLAVLKGNLAPKGAIIKHASADIKEHRRHVLIFDNADDMTKGINNLIITKDTFLILRKNGPIGTPGMPEYRYIPIPKHLLKQGVSDMVRISDARMSG